MTLTWLWLQARGTRQPIDPAAELCSRHGEVVPQGPEERHVGIGIKRLRLSIHPERNRGHGVSSSSISVRRTRTSAAAFFLHFRPRLRRPYSILARKAAGAPRMRPAEYRPGAPARRWRRRFSRRDRKFPSV